MTVKVDIQDKARALYKTFETRERADGTKFATTEDETAKSILYKVHEAMPGGTYLPNDWLYEATRDALAGIADCSIEFEEYTDEYSDGAVGVYNSDLLKWVSEPYATELIDEQVEALGYPGSFIQAIQYGQYRAHGIVYATVLGALQGDESEGID